MKIKRNLFKGLVICLGILLITGFNVMAYNQAPSLEKEVKEGNLPGVEERLPEEPKVVEPAEEIGQYGGTWNKALLKGSFTGFDRRTTEGLVRWNKEGAKVVPNLAKDWEKNEDASVWTFDIRKGIKWSDGEPLTAEDFVFNYKYVWQNEDLKAEAAPWFVGGELVEVEAIDEYTIKYTFAQPHPLAHTDFAVGMGSPVPAHHHKQYHAEFTDEEELKETAEEEGFDTWASYYMQQTDQFQAKHLIPTLSAWQWPAVSGGETSIYKCKRNPYYWKVDPEGNQLPYLEGIEYVSVEDKEVLLMKVISGNVDMDSRFVKFEDMSVLRKNEDKGNYKVKYWASSVATKPIIFLNHNCPDEELRDLIQNLDFRKALSYAIDRNEMNEILFHGLGEPAQAGSVVKNSPFYEEKFQKRYTEYRPEKARELLNKIGLDEKNSDGIRLRPDGEPLSIVLSTYSTYPTEPLELIQKYWKDVGVELVLNPMGNTALFEDIPRGEYQFASRAEADRGLRPDIDPRWIIPYLERAWAFPKFGAYFDVPGNAQYEGVKPPENEYGDNIRKSIELYEELLVTPEREKRIELMKNILDIVTENVWVIGGVGALPRPIVVKEGFKNVPDNVQTSWLIRSPANANPEQYYKVQE